MSAEVYTHMAHRRDDADALRQSLCGKVWRPSAKQAVSVGVCPECFHLAAEALTMEARS